VRPEGSAHHRRAHGREEARVPRSPFRVKQIMGIGESVRMLADDIVILTLIDLPGSC
jgi:hypothetical protein